MIFETSIFIPTKKPYFDLLRSEKISYAALGIMILSFIFIKLSNDYLSGTLFLFLSLGLLFLGVAAVIVASLSTFWEYENLNGYFKGEVKINIENIIINQKCYRWSEISNLKLAILNYKGERTHRRGASFYQGISNHISFTYNSQEFSVSFLLVSKEHIEDLYTILVSTIVQEKINYSRNLINLIPDKYRKSRI